MITNDRQYRITRAEADRFRQAITAAEVQGSNLSPRMHQAMLDGLKSQLNDLEQEIEQYDAIRNGDYDEVDLTSLADLPSILIMARIASHLTQAELAGKLEMHEQQVQRYEANLYASASLSRLIAIADTLDLTIKGTASLPQPEPHGFRETIQGGERPTLLTFPVRSGTAPKPSWQIEEPISLAADTGSGQPIQYFVENAEHRAFGRIFRVPLLDQMHLRWDYLSNIMKGRLAVITVRTLGGNEYRTKSFELITDEDLVLTEGQSIAPKDVETIEVGFINTET